MLRGWILLADSCPHGCNVPLVQHKTSGLQKCVQCNYEKQKLKEAERAVPSVREIENTPSEAIKGDWAATVRQILGNQTLLLARSLDVTSSSLDDTRFRLEMMDSLLQLHQRLDKY